MSQNKLCKIQTFSAAKNSKEYIIFLRLKKPFITLSSFLFHELKKHIFLVKYVARYIGIAHPQFGILILNFPLLIQNFVLFIDSEISLASNLSISAHLLRFRHSSASFANSEFLHLSFKEVILSPPIYLLLNLVVCLPIVQQESFHCSTFF